MSKDTLSRRSRSRARRNQARIAALAIAAAGVAGMAPAPAAAGVKAGPPAQKIAGGVEDGTFRGPCLQGDGTPTPTRVLGAGPWRNGIGANVVRVLVPWNVASDPRFAKTASCLADYLKAAARNKTDVEVSLNRQTDGKPDDPSVPAYRTAIRALAGLTRGGRPIRYLTPYNEPDNPGYFSDPHPASRSGRYYRIANQNKTFRGKVIAGDFSEHATQGFVKGYIKALGGMHASAWAIHPYTDVTNFQYFMWDKQHHRTARQAARMTLNQKNSYTVRFAGWLKNYGPANIWLNEIYVTHTADRTPPDGVKGAKGKTMFTQRNQGYAGLFMNGGLGPDSLPGYLAGHGLPRLTRYVYMRAGTTPLPEAYVLIINQQGCLWKSFAGGATAPAANCTK